MALSDNVNHPDHYTMSMPAVQIECIDFSRNMSFCQGNAFKYVWRAGHKDDAVEDLQKAIWYLQRATVYSMGTYLLHQWEYVHEKLFNTLSPVGKRRLNILNEIIQQDYKQAITLIEEWITDFKKDEVTNND